MQTSVKRQNLNDQVAEILRREVTALPPGARLPPEPALAARFGVSVRTVREAVAQLVQEKRLARRQGSGTYVLDAGAQQHVAILMEADFGSPETPFFWRRLIQDLRQMLRADGYRTRLYTGHSPWGMTKTPNVLTCDEFLDDLNAGSIRAVLAVATMTVQPWWEPITRRGIPLVGDDHRLPVCVLSDAANMAQLALQHFRAQGRGRLAVVDLVTAGSLSANGSAFLAAAASQGVAVRPEHLITVPFRHEWQSVARQLETLWQAKRRPDGLMVLSDYVFPAVGVSLIKLGIRIPDELLVVKHEVAGDAWPELFPVVRVVTEPQRVAREMIALLEAQLAGAAPPPGPHLVPAHVVLPQNAATALATAR